MANDDETLTFRLRAIAENMSAFGKAARGADEVTASMIKSKAAAEQLANSNKKLTAARDKESDAAGKVRVAESKLNDVMAKSEQSRTKIAAAEENLANARTEGAGKVRVAESKLNDVMSKGEQDRTKIAVAEERLATTRANAASKVRDAEAKLNDVMLKGGQDRTKIAVAEERLATARANSTRATNDANKIEADFKKLATGALGKIAEDSGETGGRRFLAGFKKFFGKGDLGKSIEQDLAAVGSDAAKGGSLIGRTFGTGILSGLEGLLKSEAGPFILAALVAVAAVVSPAIGAVLAGGIVLAFGAGLAALAIVFALKTATVKAKWKETTKAMSVDLQGIAAPFDAVMIHLADSMRNTLGRFAPLLRTVFANSAGPVQKFADDVLGALERFKPALVPISDAFNRLLASLGPALKDSFTSIADGLIAISNSVSNNPNGLPDFIRGIGTLTQELLVIIGILNDANGAFERLTGGTSAVTAFMYALEYVVGLVLGPFILLAKYTSFVADVFTTLTTNSKAAGDAMSGAANHTAQLLQGLQQTGGAAKALQKPLKDTHDIAVANAAAASAAATKFDQWVSSMFKLQNEAIDVAQSQLDLKQSFADAAATITGGTAKVVAARNKDAAAAGRVTVAEAQLNQLRQSGKATHAQIVAAEVRLSDARRNAKIAADNLTKATAANSKGLDLNSQKGRDEYQALLKVARQANDTTEKMIRHKQALGTVTAAAQLTKENFIKLAEEMGFNSKQAHKMAQDMIAIPNVKRTATMDANTAALKRKLAAAQAQIDHMHGKVIPITYTVDGVNFTLNTKQPAQAGRGATGGQIRGPGSGTSDRAGLFALSNKEWVIRAKASEKYGDKAMASVNAGTATVIPGMAAGGAVDIHGYGAFKDQTQLRTYLGKKFPPITSTPSGGGGGGNGGSGVARWRGVALAALAAAHEPASWIDSLLRRMNQESGGNPRAINNWDSNAKRGDPSRGLMQTIGSTFNAYADGYRSRGIYDPFANIFAAIKYTVARYGSGPAGWNRKGGYSNGGWLMPGDSAYNETRKPEAVFNQTQLGQLGGPLAITLTVETGGAPMDQLLATLIRKYVRVNGGDVQKVLGRHG